MSFVAGFHSGLCVCEQLFEEFRVPREPVLSPPAPSGYPSWEVFHPGEIFDEVCAWGGGGQTTGGELVDTDDVGVSGVGDGGDTVDDGLDEGGRCTAEVVVVAGGVLEELMGQKNGLGFVETEVVSRDLLVQNPGTSLC